MSRRARLEDEKLKQLNNELQEEEDKIKLQKERIYAPVVWKRYASGLRIEDLKPKYYDEILKMIQEHYLPEEVLCRNTNLKDDPVSVECYMHKVMFNLQDKASIIVIDEENEDRVAGCLILRAVHKVDFGRVFSRVQLIEGEAYQKCVTVANFLSRKADIYSLLECDIFLRYYLMCIKPEYRSKGLGFKLMLTAQDVARSLNIPVVMGMFSCYTLQKLARKIGMKTIFEVNYVDWKDSKGVMIFEEPGNGNYTIGIMAGAVPPLPEPEPVPVQEEEVVKMTREEKRKSKQKKGGKKK